MIVRSYSYVASLGHRDKKPLSLINHHGGHLWSHLDYERERGHFPVPMPGDKVSGRVSVGDIAPRPGETSALGTHPARALTRQAPGKPRVSEAKDLHVIVIRQDYELQAEYLPS